MTLHFPPSPEGKAELARRAAGAHAGAAEGFLRRLPCPAQQKRELLCRLLSRCRREKRQKPAGT